MSQTTAPLAHHFDSLAQQRESVSLGMWLFLVTEILFFGGIFTVYLIYRSKYGEAFAAGSEHLDIGLGAINTVVLIVSSLTMAMAVHAAQLGHRKQIIGYLILTILFGATFLGIKSVEYRHKFEEHLFPGPSFSLAPHGEGSHGAEDGSAHGADGGTTHGAETGSAHGADAGAARAGGTHDAEAESQQGAGAGGAFETAGGDPHAAIAADPLGVDAGHVRLFFSVYFFMTSLHALHMVVGIGLLVWLIVAAGQGRYSPGYYNPVEMVGLYWHFVDIVWIYLFPLLYLIGRH